MRCSSRHRSFTSPVTLFGYEAHRDSRIDRIDRPERSGRCRRAPGPPSGRRHGVEILPVDSEHNAIHQCMHGRSFSEIRRLILTASGGPFRGRSATDLAMVTADAALQHPTWRMGRKITIDSATLMNKGLE